MTAAEKLRRSTTIADVYTHTHTHTHTHSQPINQRPINNM